MLNLFHVSRVSIEIYLEVLRNYSNSSSLPFLSFFLASANTIHTEESYASQVHRFSVNRNADNYRSPAPSLSSHCSFLASLSSRVLLRLLFFISVRCSGKAARRRGVAF